MARIAPGLVRVVLKYPQHRRILRKSVGSRLPPRNLHCGRAGVCWAHMGRQVAVVLYVVAMAAVIVGIDFLFFRHRFWERLTVNIGIVLVFAAFYLRFLKRP
jgi:hypothetical protein